MIVILSGIWWNLNIALLFIFLVDKDVGFLKKYLWVICTSSFESYVFSLGFVFCFLPITWLGTLNLDAQFIEFFIYATYKLSFQWVSGKAYSHL